MSPTVAVVAPGNMGAAVARRLVEHGVQVLTSTVGRSAASAARAAAAGMRCVPFAQLIDVDLVLSVVPPAAALGFAAEFAGLLTPGSPCPLFVDCNAVSPATVARIAALITAAGGSIADACIIGGPPRPGIAGPAFYASGGHAGRFARLSSHGLDIRLLDGPIGAASALKMSYAGITKGFIAVGTAMMLAATRAGAADALRRELAESQPGLLSFLERTVPQMFPKAYRWVAEMQEIAAFAGEDPAAAQIFTAAAQLYRRLADDAGGEGRETSAAACFLAAPR